MNKVDHKKLRDTPPFDILTREEFDGITKEAELLLFKKNEFLFHEDEEEIELYFLIAGSAKNILHKTSGEQFSVRYYYPGDLIGLMIMLAGGQMTFSVQAIQDCEVFLLKKAALLQVMAKNEAFSEIVLEGIGDRMKTLYDEIKREHNGEETENIPLLRTRIDRIMSKATFISPNDTIIQAARRLRSQTNVGLVVVDEENRLLGTVTQRDLLHAIVLNDTNKLVRDIMNKKPYRAPVDSFSYDVLSYFKDDHVDFIPVVKQDKVVGALTAESFLQLQASNYVSLSHGIHHAPSLDLVAKYAAVNNRLFIDFVEQLLSENTYAYDVCELISNYNDKVHRQVIKMALKEMKEEGFGTPPINYCFIVMGSQGRKEQAFSTDQDNGLILDNYEHLPNKDEIETYFKTFAYKINHGLVACGFPLCTGEVMAKEAKWRRSLNNWIVEVERWVKETDSEEIRDFTIFIDYRPIFGDFSLARNLREATTATVTKGKMLHLLLMKDTIRFRVPLNPFGMITTSGKEHSINLKKAAIMQIVNGVRIFSIKNGIHEENTIKRLNLLKEMEVFHPRDVTNAQTVLHILMRMRLLNNIGQLRNNLNLSNELSLDFVDKEEKKKLKEALSIAKRLQQMSELSFGRKRGI
ncbi:DUF294 nucleotidyltransferase-like domain-containing protein [Anaerobacillus isosaccharinicus]|uniref:CBS domain-containing protein n=1 Tax=Anaerobacillus isosaccharinicus TaxID=1532552 RepID=A0A1S2L5C5_9BACI|nr:DUF294 nucleotidyltransferase-like domain-containing protein [Anaerobacillus isosaccharinicus]MBA5586932.1 CBS domain-containing protein [Anaerobacillus isosaccharinicus]QOY34862.1 CBS domain-containing protein [Anaerobacillus isosaccharinicus]